MIRRREGTAAADLVAETDVKAVAIVDPYDAGAMLAAMLRQHHVVPIMVQSTPAIPPDQVAAFDPTAYAVIVCEPGRLDAMLATLRAREVDCVIAGSERGVALADGLSEALGVRSNGTHLSEARRNKFAMIERVGLGGLRVPRQFRSDDLDAMLDWIRREGGWPVVLKPLDAMGSDGVRLCACEGEVASAFRAIHGHTNVLGRVNAAVLAQEFIAGTEYVVDTVSRDGRHRLAGLWVYGKPQPAYATVGMFTTKELLPATGPRADALFAYATGVLDALEIRHGAAHCEVIVDAAGPALVEIGARLHGGPPAHQMMRAAAGTSQLDLLVQSVLFPDRFLAGLDARYDLPGAAVMVMLRSADLKGEIEALPSAHEVRWNAATGAAAPAVAGLVTGLATLIHRDRRVVDTDRAIVGGEIACEILEFARGGRGDRAGLAQPARALARQPRLQRTGLVSRGARFASWARAAGLGRGARGAHRRHPAAGARS